jgi:methylglutaconyl-CoA hydratase
MVTVSDQQSVRLLTLNDPQRRNPLSPALVQGLLAALDTAAQDPAIRAVVLTGTGPAFSAGGPTWNFSSRLPLPGQRLTMLIPSS